VSAPFASPTLRVILADGSAPLPAEVRAALVAGLLGRGYRVSYVRDTAIDGARVCLLPADGSSMTEHSVPIEGLDVDAIVARVDALRAACSLPAPGGWKPWFPVIDYSRCTNCMQCLSFCLFDVYGVSPEGKIQVQNQSNCKTDCPACSRVCPEVAILFPKYRYGPINGDEIDPEDLRREAMKVDISALLGGDIYQALRDRSARAKSRFARERDDQRALKERQKCLQQLRRDLDLPPEVLAALPTPEEMRARAESAMARARAATAHPEAAPPPVSEP